MNIKENEILNENYNKLKSLGYKLGYIYDNIDDLKLNNKQKEALLLMIENHTIITKELGFDEGVESMQISLKALLNIKEDE